MGIRGLEPKGIWHDEGVRWAKTGHLDQGGCWCPDCLNIDMDDYEP